MRKLSDKMVITNRWHGAAGIVKDEMRVLAGSVLQRARDYRACCAVAHSWKKGINTSPGRWWLVRELF